MVRPGRRRQPGMSLICYSVSSGLGAAPGSWVGYGEIPGTYHLDVEGAAILRPGQVVNGAKRRVRVHSRCRGSDTEVAAAGGVAYDFNGDLRLRAGRVKSTERELIPRLGSAGVKAFRYGKTLAGDGAGVPVCVVVGEGLSSEVNRIG